MRYTHFAVQALGKLMSVGLMILPAAATRFRATGPAIILVAGAIHAASVVLGRQGSLMARYLPRPHLQS